MSPIPPVPKTPHVRQRGGLVTVAAAVVVVLGVGVVLSLARAFMIPVAFALLLAVAFSPVANLLERRAKFPVWASAIVALIVAGSLAASVGLVAYLGVSQVVRSLPRYREALLESLRGGVVRIEGLLGEEFVDGLDLTNGGLEVLVGNDPSAMVRTIVGSSLGFVSSLALTLLFLVFFVATRKTLHTKLHELLESRGFSRAEARRTLDQLGSQVTRYLWLKTAICVVTGAAFGLAAWLGGTPFPLFWGFVAFAFNYAPSIGPLIASIVPIILTLLEVEPLAWAIGLSAILAAIQLISGVLVEPKLLGDRLDLNIITVFLSLLFWGLVWGPMGMLLGVPLTGIIHIALDSSERTRDIGALLGS